MMKRIHVIDSHTGGEPTRVIVSGGPDLGTGTLLERREKFRKEFDAIRSAVVNEPRGTDVLVGAMLCPPVDPTCAAGVIFFNNVSYLGMCGHGMIGVGVTLGHLGRIAKGIHRIETPVGLVTLDYDGKNQVRIENVLSYRYRQDIELTLPQTQEKITGDIAWGGNWFFLVKQHSQQVTRDRLDALSAFTMAVRDELARQQITGPNGSEIDHIEVFGPPEHPQADSKNYVLCPGKAYDRSPCGTGTSAKLACLFADGKLQVGQTWIQESIIGSLFVGSVRPQDHGVIPSIQGSAYVNAESVLLLNEDDPFCHGIRS